MATLPEYLTASKILTLHFVGSAPLQGSVMQERHIAREREKYATCQPGDQNTRVLLLFLSFSYFVFEVISSSHTHTHTHTQHEMRPVITLLICLLNE